MLLSYCETGVKCMFILVCDVGKSVWYKLLLFAILLAFSPLDAYKIIVLNKSGVKRIVFTFESKMVLKLF